MTNPARTGAATGAPIPTLREGDRLDRAEFERRYEAMPGLKKAELIEGVVYVPSPVSTERHGAPHSLLGMWLAVYASNTPGTQAADNASLRLDDRNEPQPDLFLRILPEHGGQSRRDGIYTAGMPELLGEVTAGRSSYDLHQKLEVYRRHGAREYVVWRVVDDALDWFVLREGRFVPLPRGADGILRSFAFPGLWLDETALRRRDGKAVLEVLDRGVNSPEHTAFAERLRAQTR